MRRESCFTVWVVYMQRKFLVAVFGKLASRIISAFFSAQLASVLNITKNTVKACNIASMGRVASEKGA